MRPNIHEFNEKRRFTKKPTSTRIQFVDVHNKSGKVTSLPDKLKIMAAGCSERARANGIAVSMYKPCENWIYLLPMTPIPMQAFDCGVVGKGKDNALSVTGAV